MASIFYYTNLGSQSTEKQTLWTRHGVALGYLFANTSSLLSERSWSSVSASNQPGSNSWTTLGLHPASSISIHEQRYGRAYGSSRTTLVSNIYLSPLCTLYPPCVCLPLWALYRRRLLPEDLYDFPEYLFHIVLNLPLLLSPFLFVAWLDVVGCLWLGGLCLSGVPVSYRKSLCCLLFKSMSLFL